MQQDEFFIFVPMNPIKRLAGQTAIYGLPSIIGRILGYLLVPLYTRVFSQAEYGVVNVFYSYTALLLVILTYGMETAFFRYAEKEGDKNRVFSTGFLSLVLSTSGFLVLVLIFSGTIARWIQYPGHPNYVTWFALIIAFDVLSSIPFAKLRALNRPIRFAAIKLVNIALNICLNLFFILLCPWLMKHADGTFYDHFLRFIYNPAWGIEYIFISNLIASLVMMILLIPEMRGFRMKMDPKLWRSMFIYALPLLFAGLAGVANETFDRILLRYLLPSDIAEAEVGVYGACYKIAILMTLFIQAYRYAAEPFFFSYAKEKDAHQTYSRIMTFFVITVSVLFLVTMLYLDDVVIRFIGKDFREGRAVIPILMLAHLFLGVYYNLSIWYKLTGQTVYGAYLSVAGSIITVALNILWIPRSPDHYLSGYMGSAWATFIGYGLMMVFSYFLGQRYYRIPYNLVKITGYLGFAVVLYFLTVFIHPGNIFLRLVFHSLLLVIYVVVVGWTERKEFKAFFST
jgi:O-antigen/teichoic acid export membrane protein